MFQRGSKESSLQLFTVEGYYNTSVNEILEVTGLTKGRLYGHFSSKEAIWYAAILDQTILQLRHYINQLRK